MYKVHAYQRTSHSYVDGWRHLDNDEFVATVKLTPAKQIADGKSFDEGGTWVQYARAPAGVSIPKLIQALRDTMGGSNCRHEHDCCGCASSSVRIQHLGSRRLMVRTQVSFNY